MIYSGNEMTEMFIPDHVQKIINRLEEHGFEAYLVGGCVRDALLGKTPGDYDMAVSSYPEETKEIFSDFRTIDTGIKHGTVTVVSEHNNLELTSFRHDGEYIDNRRPESVEFTRDIHADVSRRDLTVNALAYSPLHGLIDDFGGKKDLENKILRCVGNAEKRFEEDALRIMRTVRFSAVLDFAVEENTAKAVINKKDLLKNISVERIFTELKKTLDGTAHEKALIQFREIIFTVIPELEELSTDEYRKSVTMIKSCTSQDMRFAALLSSLPPEKADEICHRLKTDNHFRKNVVYFIENMNKEFSSFGEVKRFAGATGKEKLPALLTFRKAAGRDDDILLERTVEYINEKNICLSINDLAVNGRDISSLGINGKATGDCLEMLLNAVTDDKTKNKKNVLLDYAKNHFLL